MRKSADEKQATDISVRIFFRKSRNKDSATLSNMCMDMWMSVGVWGVFYEKKKVGKFHRH